MALYGHEISAEMNVFEAGLDRYCKLEKGRSSAPKRSRRSRPRAGQNESWSGLEMIERGIARDGYGVFDARESRSATLPAGRPRPFSRRTSRWPMCRWNTARSVPKSLCSPQTRRAKVVPLPFYRRPKSRLSVIFRLPHVETALNSCGRKLDQAPVIHCN